MDWIGHELIQGDCIIARYFLAKDRWVGAVEGNYTYFAKDTTELDVRRALERMLRPNRCCTKQCLHHCQSVTGTMLMHKVYCCQCLTIFEADEPIKLEEKKVILDHRQINPLFKRWRSDC